MGDDLERADKGIKGVFKALTMTRTDRINAINRSVIEYNPSHVDAFFEPAKGVYNSIVSGGDRYYRNQAIIAQVACAEQNNFPVIIMHEGNSDLEQQVTSNFAGTGKLIKVNRTNPCFEPLFGLNEMEISSQILETAPSEYDLKFSARYYIDGISTFLKKSGKHLSFKMFSTCPHALIFDKVDDLKNRGAITDAEEQEIKSKLMMGQSENYKIDTFLASLKMEIDPILYVAKRGYKPVNIISSIKRNKILCFDIASVTNKLLLNTLIYQLKLALTQGLQYVIIIDSIPTNSNEAYAAYLQAPTGKACRMISSDDYYSMVGGDDKTFSATIGDSQIIIVMGHTAGHSAAKWAEVFGQYDKFEESFSTSRGSSRRTPFSLMPSPNFNRTVSVSKSREYIVKPESITRMGNSEAYILSAARGELAHLQLIG